MKTINRSRINNIILHRDLTGQKITVINHSDPKLINVSGMVTSETKNMVIIQTIEGKFLKIAKNMGSFLFIINSSKIIINGKLLIGNPKTRTKKKFRNW